jgi:TonB family protein
MIASALEFLIKSSVLLVPLLALGYCRYLSAAERHALTLAGLLSVPVIACVGGWLDWQIHLTAQSTEAPAVIRQQAGPALQSAAVIADSGSATAADGGISRLLLLYICVAMLLGARACTSWWRISRHMRRLDRIDPPAALAALANGLDLRCADCASPWTWGIRHPVVVLPCGFEHWPSHKQIDALHHELAHVKRHDCLTQMVAHSLAVVFWFQPLVWVARRRLGRLAEQASDDCVLTQGSPAPDYAQCLIDIARDNDSAPAPGMAMSRHPLNHRIKAILDPSLRRMPISARQFSALAALILGAAVPVAAVTLEPGLADERAYVPVLKMAPVYPREAQNQRIEGYVVVEFEVTESGATRNVHVFEESPPGVFGPAAVGAARQFLYLPARRDGRNVAVSGIRNRITFELTEDGHGETEDKVSIDWESTQASLESTVAASDPLDAQLLARAASAAHAERTRNQRLLSDIITRAEAEAQRTGNGDTFLQAARLASALQETGHAIHCLLRASELELSTPDDALRNEFGMVLLSVGRLSEAKALFADQADSDDLSQQWLTFLEREEQRRSVVHDALARTLRSVVQR